MVAVHLLFVCDWCLGFRVCLCCWRSSCGFDLGLRLWPVLLAAWFWLRGGLCCIVDLVWMV